MIDYTVVIAGDVLPQISVVMGRSVIRCAESLDELSPFLQQPSTAVVLASEFLRTPSGTAFWETTRINRSVVIVVYEPRVEDGLDAVLAGCSGLVTHDTQPQQFVAVLHQIAEGELAVSPALLSLALKECLARTPRAVLTSREQEIFRLASYGFSNQAIAERLFVSRDTIRWHLRSIHAKLGPVALRRSSKRNEANSVSPPTTGDHID